MGQDPQAEIISILKDLQKQIGYLEKKIDLLSSGSSDRRSFKPRNHFSPSSSRYPAGTRPSSEGSRYKNKFESSYGDKKSSTSKWYKKKQGDGSSAGEKRKRAYKPANKRGPSSK